MKGGLTMAMQIGDLICRRIGISAAVKAAEKKAVRKAVRKDGKKACRRGEGYVPAPRYRGFAD